MLFAESSNERIAYDDYGAGEPALLFMPGWCATRKAFGRLPELCAAHGRTLALDWRGHGDSGQASGDFGSEGLLADALAVIQASRADNVIPVALAHSGWVAIELRRRLAERVPKLILLEWIVTDPPPVFVAALEGLQDSQKWRETRDHLFALWLEGVANHEVVEFVRGAMGAFGAEMWKRGGREIAKAYRQAGNPLRALNGLTPSLPVLHLCVPLPHPETWAAQEAFAALHPWFKPRQLNARSHFPMLEIPEEMASIIAGFAAGK